MIHAYRIRELEMDINSSRTLAIALDDACVEVAIATCPASEQKERGQALYDLLKAVSNLRLLDEEWKAAEDAWIDRFVIARREAR